jgi:hypothetical protein
VPFALVAQSAYSSNVATRRRLVVDQFLKGEFEMKKTIATKRARKLSGAPMIHLSGLRRGMKTCHGQAQYDEQGDAILGYVGAEVSDPLTPALQVTFPQGSSAKQVARLLRKCADLLERVNGARIMQLTTGELDDSDLVRTKSGRMHFLNSQLDCSYGRCCELWADHVGS